MLGIILSSCRNKKGRPIYGYGRFYTNSTFKTVQRKWSVFMWGEKENLSIALVTLVFYFEASRKKKRFIEWF